MNKATRNGDAIILALCALGVLISRFPFLSAGYGMDSDAWRVANAARSIAVSGIYSASRLPGYPLQEYFYSLIWKAGPFTFNLVTATLSAFGFIFFALILRHVGSKDFILFGLALVFTPVIYINSTNSLSDVWALTLILGSIYSVHIRRYFIGGLFLGLAIGCRITSALLIVPILLTSIVQVKRLDLKAVLTFSSVSFLLGIAAFIPVFLRYGLDFFSLSDIVTPNIITIIHDTSIGVWGTIGSLAVIMAIGSVVLFPTKSTSVSRSSATNLIILSWALAVLVIISSFLRLPHRSRYLIPMIPFALLLLSSFLDRRRSITLCITLIISSFFITIDRSGWYLEGPILRDHSTRLERNAFIRDVLTWGENKSENSVVVAGAYLPLIEGGLSTRQHGKVVYLYLLNEDQAHDYSRKGFLLYYLPNQREFNFRVYGFDLVDFGATPVDIPGQ